MNWVVYHSTRVMGEPCSSLGERAAYSTRDRPKLGLGDTVWVIEGPGEFALVDAFKVARTETPSPVGPFARFKLKIMGDISLLAARVSLSLDLPWFNRLHSAYLTKRRFFGSLGNEPEVLSGLRALCPSTNKLLEPSGDR